jgi:uncharacterized iron-regulated protein
MIEYAKQNKLNVIAANPPRRYVSMVSRRGMRSLDSLSKDAKKFLPPLPYDTLTGRYRDKFMETMKGSPGGGSPNIYYSQSLWDAGMSYSIYKFLRNINSRKYSIVLAVFIVMKNSALWHNCKKENRD